MKPQNARLLLTLLSSTAILFCITGWVLWDVYGDRLIEAAYNGCSLPLVNKYIGIHRSIDPAHRTLDYFLRNGKPVVPRLFGLLIVAQLLLVAGVRYGRTTVSRFFSAATHPVNLAVFRIILFASLLFYVDVSRVIQFSRFPADLLVAPPGLGWLLNVLPINPTFATAASVLFVIVCVSGFFGFYSRTSAAAAVILGFYVLGIPQFFGKIDHYHHLLWFTALLVASPCGDVLSVDALMARRKKEKRPAVVPTNAHTIPLRFVMLLMGIIYFFAGVWKSVVGGSGWATGETMKYILYAQWFRLDWLPALRIDHFPLLYEAAGIGVIVFELSFIVLIFFPRLRKFAVLGGIGFHLSVYLFAHINFWTLVLCYAVFVDFEPLYRRFMKAERNVSAAAAPKRATAAIIVGGSLLAINILCGLFLIDSWPFAVYPTFAGVEEKYIQSLTIVLESQDSTLTEIVPYHEQSLQTTIRPSRMIGLFNQVLWATDSSEVRRHGVALADVLSHEDRRIRDAKSILMYKDICSVVPEEWKDNPVRRELLLRIEK